MANTYLVRTPSSAGNRKTFTISTWIKRSKLSYSYAYIITAGEYNQNQMGQLKFDDNDRLNFSGYNSSGSQEFRILTTNRFRDVSGWYHIVVSVDTTQATASNRVKIYINNEQVTDFQEASYPSQNHDTAFNLNGIQSNIGIRAGTSTYFEGCMSHFHLVDGSALAPTVFGSTDSTTGEWKINTAPSYTVGTNGFFILKDTNSGTDQSANSNNYTVGGGTLTKTEDNPSNVFATLNSLKILGTTNRIISNGNTKFYTGTTHWGTMLSTLAFSSGKFYCEVKLDTIQGSAGYGALGITDATENYQSNDNIQQQSSFSAGCVTDHRSGQSACKVAGSTVSSGIGNFSNGDIVGIAADMDNKALYLHKNGTYITVGGVTGVPTSGSSKTGALTIPATCVDCMFSISSYTSDATSSVNFGNGYFGTTAVSSVGTNASGIGVFEFDVPTGYTALSTKGLNE